MRKSERTMYRINEVQRHTIRIKRCKYQSRNIGNHSIHICVRPWLCDAVSTVFFCDKADIRRMCLIRGYNIVHIEACGIGHSLIIFFYRFLFIPSGKAQIHRGINSLTDTSKPGAEGMHKSGQFIKFRISKISHALSCIYPHLGFLFLMPFYICHQYPPSVFYPQ